MSNTYFAFRQFTIYHDKCAMKVGTDGVLLGAWVDPHTAGSILDVGTGTGLIAIMLAQRSSALIHGVEIDESAFQQAKANARLCPWNARLNFSHDSFQCFARQTQYHYDLIVSNPPFFRNSLRPPALGRQLARHDDRLSYECLFFYASSLLTKTGRFSLIIPFEETENINRLALFNRFHLHKQTIVQAYPEKPPIRCLFEFSKGQVHQPLITEMAIRKRTGDDYSTDYKMLTGAYYL
jgi:tRNA1Val (adenine37-N6)-methyltransferase